MKQLGQAFGVALGRFIIAAEYTIGVWFIAHFLGRPW